jgi:hypothetical protein
VQQLQVSIHKLTPPPPAEISWALLMPLAFRNRGITCDEGRPACNKCTRSGRLCDGVAPYKIIVDYGISREPSSGSSSSSTTSIISTPSLSWSASSIAESDELLNTDLKIPHGSQQGAKVLGRTKRKHFRTACFACQTSKTRCRCPLPKQSESSARPVERRPPGQVAEFASSGSKTDSYQIPIQQIGSLSPSPAHITQSTRSSGHVFHDLTSNTPVESHSSMDELWPFEETWGPTSPRHTQNLSSGVIGMEAPLTDHSLSTYHWNDTPTMGVSMVPTVHNTENNIAQLRKTPIKDSSKGRVKFIQGYHPDQEAQKEDEKVIKVDEYPRSSNKSPRLRSQKDITNLPSWTKKWPASFNSEWPEAGLVNPMLFEQGSTEPVELPVFPTYYRETSPNTFFSELESVEKDTELFEPSTPFNADLPRHYASVSGLESFPLPPDISESARSSDFPLISPGFSSPRPASDDFSSTEKGSFGFEPTRNKVSHNPSNCGEDHNTGTCRRFFSYKYPEVAKAYPCPCSSCGKDVSNDKKLFTRTNDLRVRSCYLHVTLNLGTGY